MQIHPLMRLGLIPIFSMAFVCNKEISLLRQELQWRQDTSWKKHNACRKTLCEQRQDTLNEIEPHHFFLHNMCLKKGRIPLLKHDVYLALLFQPFGRHTAYMQPYLFPKIKIDVYFAFFHLIAKVFNELVRNLVKVHRKLCTYRHQHMFSGKPFSCRTCTQRIPFLHIVALLPLLLWRSFAQLSLWNWFCIHVK